MISRKNLQNPYRRKCQFYRNATLYNHLFNFTSYIHDNTSYPFITFWLKCVATPLKRVVATHSNQKMIKEYHDEDEIDFKNLSRRQKILKFQWQLTVEKNELIKIRLILSINCLYLKHYFKSGFRSFFSLIKF